MAEEDFIRWEEKYLDKWDLGISLVLTKSLVEVARKVQGEPIGFQGFSLLRKKLKTYSEEMAKAKNFSGTMGESLYEAFIFAVIGSKNLTTREVSPKLEEVVNAAEKIETATPEEAKKIGTFLQEFTEQYYKLRGIKEYYREGYRQCL